MFLAHHHDHAAVFSTSRRADGCRHTRRRDVAHRKHALRQWRHVRLPACRPCAHSSGAGKTVDVVVVGAGIIGLSTAATLLRQRDPPLSVAVIDREVPCAGATGAGQGYIWLAHRSIGDAAWELAKHSKDRWQALLDEPHRDATYSEAVQWQANGSILLATDAAGADALETRATALCAQGIAADVLSAQQTMRAEPAVALPACGGSLLVPSDAQLDGKAAAAALQQACEAAGTRCSLLFHEAVEGLLMAEPEAGSGRRRARGVRTAARRVHARQATVLCAGAWSGQLLDRALGCSTYAQLISPMRGHLLQLPAAAVRGLKLAHGVMETAYCAHYAQPDAQPSAVGEAVRLEQPRSALDITFTATTQVTGDLLLGSSRDEVGFDGSASQHIVQAILEHSKRFLPSLDVDQARDAAVVRVGLRPHAARGLPLVGSIPGIDGLLLNAGHSGSGLVLAPVSAALTAGMLDSGHASTALEDDKLRAAAALLAPPPPHWADCQV